MEQLKYNVVYEGVGGPRSSHPGVRMIVAYNDEANFLDSQERWENNDKVLARGVSDKDAHEIASGTSPEARIIAAVAESVIGGHVDVNLLRLHLGNVASRLEFPIVMFNFRTAEELGKAEN